MVDFATARTKMVDNQLRTFDVNTPEVLDAMGAVPRESFVPVGKRPLAYIDEDLALNGNGAADRFLMKPALFAKMVKTVEVAPDDIVLVIGCGTGYSAAVLAKMASSVVALESDADLAATASQVLVDLGFDNVAVVEGPLQDGWKQEAPYDVILVEGAVEALPAALLEQLKDGGRLIAVEGHGNAATAVLYIRSGDEAPGRAAFNASVKPLPGFSKEPEFVF
ncbi:MAG: protein-L-isoaspartate O-methyltransferase [Hyphomicrobiales bacterium]|nr:MAG: protein-L-isoaspartate O-methyltransferase [Hyphomicrobiales bacterium]